MAKVSRATHTEIVGACSREISSWVILVVHGPRNQPIEFNPMWTSEVDALLHKVKHVNAWTG